MENIKKDNSGLDAAELGQPVVEKVGDKWGVRIPHYDSDEVYGPFHTVAAADQCAEYGDWSEREGIELIDRIAFGHEDYPETASGRAKGKAMAWIDLGLDIWIPQLPRGNGSLYIKCATGKISVMGDVLWDDVLDGRLPTCSEIVIEKGDWESLEPVAEVVARIEDADGVVIVGEDAILDAAGDMYQDYLERDLTELYGLTLAEHVDRFELENLRDMLSVRPPLTSDDGLTDKLALAGAERQLRGAGFFNEDLGLGVRIVVWPQEEIVFSSQSTADAATIGLSRSGHEVARCPLSTTGARTPAELLYKGNLAKVSWSILEGDGWETVEGLAARSSRSDSRRRRLR